MATNNDDLSSIIKARWTIEKSQELAGECIDECNGDITLISALGLNLIAIALLHTKDENRGHLISEMISFINKIKEKIKKCGL